MTKLQYLTPEWLEKSGEGYRANPKFAKELKSVTVKMGFQVNADPAWGIYEDIIFGGCVTAGQLDELRFYSQEDAKANLELIVAATPQEWKRILKKESKFVTDFMMGKVTLDHGSKLRVLAVAPYANHFIDALTQYELQFSDEMSAEELEDYRAHQKQFRDELGV